MNPYLRSPLCEVCGADITKDFGRCTNGRCGKCHTKWCTAGGNTTPGHGRKWPGVDPREHAKQMFKTGSPTQDQIRAAKSALFSLNYGRGGG